MSLVPRSIHIYTMILKYWMYLSQFKENRFINDALLINMELIQCNKKSWLKPALPMLEILGIENRQPADEQLKSFAKNVKSNLTNLNKEKWRSEWLTVNDNCQSETGKLSFYRKIKIRLDLRTISNRN